MDALESVLGEVLSAAGASGAAVIDAVTGFTYAESGDCTAAGNGHEVCRLLALVEEALRAAGAPGEVESVVVTGAQGYHVVRAVPRHGDPVLLSAVLQRPDANLALASRRVATAAESLSA